MSTYQVARLVRTGNGPDYHVHGATCPDASKRRYNRPEQVQGETLADIAADVYGVADGTEYTDDFKVFPCAEGLR